MNRHDRHSNLASFATLLALVSTACGGGAQGTETANAANGAEGADGERHSIHVHRPFTAGQRFAVVVDAEQIIEAAVEDQEEGQDAHITGVTEGLRIHLEAEVTIRDVDEEGRAAQATLVINRFVDPEDGAEILAAGSVIVAERDDEGMNISLVDGELNEDHALLLDLAFPLDRPGSPLGDELFGTDEPRAINDTWDINSAYVVEDLAEEDFGVTETNVGGQARLADVRECAVGRCMMVEATIEAEQASFSRQSETVEIGAGTLRAIVRVELPVDETRPVLGEEATVTGTFTASYQADGAEAQSQVAISRMRRATYTPLD